MVAGRVQAQHPDWPDEEVFQRARRIVVATLQVSQLHVIELYDAFASFIRTPLVVVMKMLCWKHSSFLCLAEYFLLYYLIYDELCVHFC